jgi:hypothetical protein
MRRFLGEEKIRLSESKIIKQENIEHRLTDFDFILKGTPAKREGDGRMT